MMAFENSSLRIIKFCIILVLFMVKCIGNSLSDRNVFLPYIFPHFRNVSDILAQQIILDSLNITTPHFWFRFTSWDDFVSGVNAVGGNDAVGSVLINTVGGIGVGKLLEGILNSYKLNHKNSGNQITPPVIDFALNKLNKKVTFFHIEGPNWGPLSAIIPGRTAMGDTGRSLNARLRAFGATYDSFRSFVNHANVVAYFANGAIDDELGFNPKILPIPLGIEHLSHQYNKKLFEALLLFSNEQIEKKTLLLINTASGSHRDHIVHALERQMNFTVKHSYNDKLHHVDLYRSMTQSKFVFCPPGIGYDTFRVWETLILGSIPVVESNRAGLDRIYGKLPVLIVRRFSEVNETFLNDAYSCFVKHASQWQFEHLSVPYWRKLVLDVVRNASVDIYNNDNPAF